MEFGGGWFRVRGGQGLGVWGFRVSDLGFRVCFQRHRHRDDACTHDTGIEMTRVYLAEINMSAAYPSACWDCALCAHFLRGSVRRSWGTTIGALIIRIGFPLKRSVNGFLKGIYSRVL